MGKTQQAAGGGKVTVEGLSPEKIKAGETITIRQGSKAVGQTTGSYRGFVYLGTLNSATINVKKILPNDYAKLELSNFALVNANTYVWLISGQFGSLWWTEYPLKSYDKKTGILTCSNGGEQQKVNMALRGEVYALIP